MKCAVSTCDGRVRQPYIRLATGERGGPGDYEEHFFCSWACAVAWAGGR